MSWLKRNWHKLAVAASVIVGLSCQFLPPEYLQPCQIAAKLASTVTGS